MGKIKLVSVKDYCEKNNVSRSKVYNDFRLGLIKGKYIKISKDELRVEME